MPLRLYCFSTITICSQIALGFTGSSEADSADFFGAALDFAVINLDFNVSKLKAKFKVARLTTSACTDDVLTVFSQNP